ncbi:hypothetical protein HOLleu_32260 [Holothuria leucospilota]|uniref:Uncharacterized protein n=1 Tax=Holothuria leucospilota TaxID=206669 RepID=A0A9Q0YSM0_HOLLE|nr:hypothetical protein HOLleu_32260 [Holothuria leucospilota]
MVSLKQLNPVVYAEFLKGNFVVKKSKGAFSAVAIDQAHEQNNASMKGDGVVVSLPENPADLRCWMVSGPEMARLIQEFEGSTEKRKDTDGRHHEQKRHSQMEFAQDLGSLCQAMNEMGNPFAEYSSDLLVLNSRDVVDTAVADTVLQMEKVGLEQYETYVEERLVNQTVPSTDPIKRNNHHLFSRPPIREKSRKQLQISSLKNDCSLFSRQHIASQIRLGDLDDFFQNKKQACLLSLSQIGCLRTETKSDLMPCLENLASVKEDLSTLRVQVNILDGAGIINMLQPGTAKTFQGYAADFLVSYVKSQLQHIDRQGIFWDLYIPDSLKADTRSKRKKEVRRRVEPSSAVSGNWKEFLRIEKIAWDTWTTYGDVTPAFCVLRAMPDPRATDEWMQPLEPFVALLYDRTSTEEDVNHARKRLYSKRGRAIDGLPST